MKAKKLSLIIVIMLLATLIVSTLVGCAVEIAQADIFGILNDAAVNSAKQETYYVKNIITAKSGTTDNRLNVVADNEKTEVEDRMATFRSTFKINTLADEDVKEWVYGPMLPSSVKKPSKAPVEDYKYYILSHDSVKKVSNRQTATLDTFKAIKDVSPYLIENLMASIIELTETDIKDVSANKYGVTTTIKFTIAKEGHIYNNKKILITILYNKIGQLTISDSAEVKQNEYLITYQGPKITMPRYDAKFYLLDLVDINI